MLRSRLYLPKRDSPPATLLEHFAAQFPHVPYAVWEARFDRGRVTTVDGHAIAASSEYHQGATVYYEREVPGEPSSVEAENVLYRNAQILVVDKPHGMPVTPAGNYVSRSLVVRLQEAFDLPDLAPAHRLDRETAGLVLFTVDPELRALYHGLFAKKTIQREYLAVAHWRESVGRGPWLCENRLAAGEPWFKRRIVEGLPNAMTEIELIEAQREKGLFRIRPQTGKTHQLRVHMASIGAPIVGDALYAERPAADADSMQLLACRLSFTDPMTGTIHDFASRRSLSWPP